MREALLPLFTAWTGLTRAQKLAFLAVVARDSRLDEDVRGLLARIADGVPDEDGAAAVRIAREAGLRRQGRAHG
jgi:hypothetical protein